MFAEALPKFTRRVDRWANNIQELDRAREILSETADELTRINQQLPTIQRDRNRLLELNAKLSDIDRRLKPHRRRLRTAEPEGLSKSEDLLEGVQRFVREALVSQRRTRRNLEREVVKSVQREAQKPTPAEQKRKESIPSDLITLLDAYGLLDLGSLRGFLQHLDESVLKLYLPGERYSQVIQELRDYLEENP